jgi:hypothetical protein
VSIEQDAGRAPVAEWRRPIVDPVECTGSRVGLANPGFAWLLLTSRNMEGDPGPRTQHRGLANENERVTDGEGSQAIVTTFLTTTRFD